ncbi:hypothetical protein WUBG_06689 [Wuchereria bancrofti]|uniref:Uncharacterized protein n=1 Tax=Wuchereria bancrofti TaxID=6293 RepID=J9B5T7_WUCBA|nr:hypothetical protein WUBG_06689 [Wuchereria bancrofti]
MTCGRCGFHCQVYPLLISPEPPPVCLGELSGAYHVHPPLSEVAGRHFDDLSVPALLSTYTRILPACFLPSFTDKSSSHFRTVVPVLAKALHDASFHNDMDGVGISSSSENSDENTHGANSNLNGT